MKNISAEQMRRVSFDNIDIREKVMTAIHKSANEWLATLCFWIEVALLTKDVQWLKLLWYDVTEEHVINGIVEYRVSWF